VGNSFKRIPNEAEIKLEPGLFTLRCQGLSAKLHSHNSIQLTLPIGPSVSLIEQHEVCTGHLIAPGIKHQISMQSGSIGLIEPHTNLGKQLLSQLNDKPFIAIESEKCGNNINDWLTSFRQQQRILSELAAAEKEVYFESDSKRELDSRIQTLIRSLDDCFLGECLKPGAWRAQTVAKGLNLSESLFLHLFSENMGIAWRPFLLWRRLICAVRVLSTGKSATQVPISQDFPIVRI